MFMNMKNWCRILLLVVIVLTSAELTMAADPGDKPAECEISVTVNSIIEWVGNFTPISLTTMVAQGDTPSDNETQTLYINCNIEISADNTATAQLSSATDTLVTEYKLDDDGDGSATTGATVGDKGASGIADWTEYDTFLGTALAVTHVDTDGAVDITLSVQASNLAGEIADAGAYIATQTLTASWTSD